MGEDFPVDQLPKPEDQAGEQQDPVRIDVVGQEGQSDSQAAGQIVEADEGEHEHPIVHNDAAADEDDGAQSWDMAKAETMAAIQKADGTLDKDLNKIESFKDDNKRAKELLAAGAEADIDSFNNVIWDPDLSRSRDKLQIAKQSVERSRESGSAEKVEEAEHKLEQAQSEYQARANDFMERLDDEEKDLLKATKEDTVLSTFEDLYDLNPELFAEMPTSKFMDIAKNFKNLVVNEALVRRDWREVERVRNRIEDMTEAQIGLSPDSRGGVSSYAISNVMAGGAGRAHSTEALQDVRSRFDEAYSGSFDKSPRQINEAVLALIKEYAAESKARLDAAAKKITDFKDQYKPKSKDS